MNFIIEFVPVGHHDNLDHNTIIVRAQNGFPLASFSDLDTAVVFIQSEHDRALAELKSVNKK